MAHYFTHQVNHLFSTTTKSFQSIDYIERNQQQISYVYASMIEQFTMKEKLFLFIE